MLLDTELFYDELPEPHTKQILLIEDSGSDVYLVKRMLRDSYDDQFEITNVPRMSEALALLDKATFDVVLLDLNLLDIEGVAAVSALHAEIPNIPIIVHSGTHDAALRENALMCGARHFLVKGRESPFSLKFMIEQTLSHYAA